ncbi:hypothetical protein IOD13_17105 [Brevibacterium casei]|nr:hypothetical protein [Brevibacterium casei]
MAPDIWPDIGPDISPAWAAREQTRGHRQGRYEEEDHAHRRWAPAGTRGRSRDARGGCRS